MKREIRFVVDYGNALDAMKQFTDEKTANEALMGFGYLAHPAPDWIDRIRAILLYPYYYFRHILYQHRARNARRRTNNQTNRGEMRWKSEN